MFAIATFNEKAAKHAVTRLIVMHPTHQKIAARLTNVVNPLVVIHFFVSGRNNTKIIGRIHSAGNIFQRFITKLLYLTANLLTHGLISLDISYVICKQHTTKRIIETQTRLVILVSKSALLHSVNTVSFSLQIYAITSSSGELSL